MNYGNHKSIDGSTAFAINDIEIPTMDLSILNWDFDTVTTSDSSGEFAIEDTTSGSSDTIYGWVDNLIRREHDGKGDNFPTSSTAFLEKSSGKPILKVWGGSNKTFGNKKRTIMVKNPPVTPM